MLSNTKLDDYKKQERKEMKGTFLRRGGKIVNDGKTTIAYLVLGNTVKFYTSVMSPGEKKFRRKVGEYFALSNYFSDIGATLDKKDFEFFILEQMFFTPF